MMQLEQETPEESISAQRGQGCGPSIGLVIVGFVILLGTLIAQTITYGLEQTVFEGSLPVQDMRWLVALVYALVLIAFTGVLMAATQGKTRAAFRSWLMSEIFALLIVPARLVWIDDAILISALQIVGMLVFLTGMALWLRWRGGKTGIRHTPVNQQGLYLALFWGILMAFPWVLWGSLGSPLDVILDLLAGLLVGASASLILNGSLLVGKEPGLQSTRGLWADGLIFVVALVIMATGFGLNGEQWMLAIVLPPVAWAAVLFSRAGRERGGSNWPVAAVLVGLTAAWPLIWIDPDELALVISSGPGELNSWALRMCFATLAIGIIASTAVTIGRERLSGTVLQRRVTAVMAFLALIAGAAIYVTAGQQGFNGERLFVILKDQADVSSAAQIPDINARRAFVYQTLVKKADTSQAGLRAQLERWGISYKPYYLVNGIEVSAGLPLRWWLQSRPEVDRVLENPELRPLPEVPPTTVGGPLMSQLPLWNQTMIGADRVWKELGVTGKGVLVGQSDSGMQGDHPELAGSYRGRGGSNDYNWLDPWFGTSKPTDIGGHGTHTLGTILGKNVGIAPGAEWIGCVNLARNLGNPAFYLDCWQFMLAPFPQKGDALHDGDPARGAMVLNNSWGCPTVEGCDPNTFLPAVRALRAAGVFVVVSAGNSGYRGCGSLSDPPAIYDSVYSVAAVDNQGAKADFSSLGPVTVDGSGRIKPDIAAPGVNVESSYPNNTYNVASGTSMAGPHIVGVVALMWSANPKLIGNIDQTIKILNQTARPYRGPLPSCVSGQGVPNDAVGYGIVDAYAAVKMAQESR